MGDRLHRYRYYDALSQSRSRNQPITIREKAFCSKDNGNTANRNEGALYSPSRVSHRTILLIAQATHEGVVLAADGVSVAGRAAADTDDADGRAGGAEQDAGVLGDNADRLEESGTRSRARLQMNTETGQD